MNTVITTEIATYGKSLNNLNKGYLDRNGYIDDLIDSVVSLCTELLFPSMTVLDPVNTLDEILDCFRFNNTEDIKNAIQGSHMEPVYSYNKGMNTHVYCGPNKPKFLFCVARLLLVAAKKFRCLQKPERAKTAYAIAALYVQACADLLKLRKETATSELNSTLPIFLFDRGPAPDIYRLNGDALIEREFALNESQIERLGLYIKAQFTKLSDKEAEK